MKKLNIDDNLTNYDIQTTLNSDQSLCIFNIVKDIRSFVNSPSLQVSIKWNPNRSWKGCVGFANQKMKNKISNQSIYEIGSITKSFTAILVLKLIEDDHLKLKDRISKYLPDLSYGDIITIENLLNHTSGLYNYTKSLNPAFKTLFLKKKWKKTEIKEIIRAKDMVSKPGTKFNYSDQNYFLLGLIIEKITQNTYSKFLTNSIIKPLDLKETSCYSDTEQTRTISGYDSRFMPLARLGVKKEISGWQLPFKSFAFACGHMDSNASDITTFYSNLYNERILGKNSISILTNFINAEYKPLSQMTGYGLGVMRFLVGDIELWGHIGITLGFSAVSVYSPEYRYYITILANVPEVEKLIYSVSNLQKYLIQNLNITKRSS
jgi:D-alanyl-D-alanine carboxypeptidase